MFAALRNDDWRRAPNHCPRFLRNNYFIVIAAICLQYSAGFEGIPTGCAKRLPR
jgi:hypothetical protein